MRDGRREAPRGCGRRGLEAASDARSCVSADVAFITSATFVWKVSAVTAVSCLPLYALKHLKRRLAPPSYSKLSS